MEKQEALDALFSRRYYARNDHEAEPQIRLYCVHPDHLDTVGRVRHYDSRAAETIKEALDLVEALRGYREALADRYAWLTTAPTEPIVRLERERNTWTHKVHYYLRIFRLYIDTGEEVQESGTVYEGTERHKAIADFRAYVKSHPGIRAEMKIEKGSWEK